MHVTIDFDDQPVPAIAAPIRIDDVRAARRVGFRYSVNTLKPFFENWF